MKYEATQEDKLMMENDMDTNPIMRFLKNRESYSFNVGDILIKQHKRWSDESDESDEWITESNSPTGAPKKYMYVFENELGIGYVKALKVDGSGFTRALTCITTVDQEHNRFVLDPDYVDHMILGEDGGFTYNEAYKAKKAFRDEAIAKNKKLLVKVTNPKKLVEWYNGLKVGDKVWYGTSYEQLARQYCIITSIDEIPVKKLDQYRLDLLKRYDILNNIKSYKKLHVETYGNCYTDGSSYLHEMEMTDWQWRKVMMTQPFPIQDELCGHQR